MSEASKDYLKFEWLGHHTILREFTVSGTVINLDPLVVGTGRVKGDVADIVILKYFDPKLQAEVPVIPGSSWKGAFRSHAVRLARYEGLKVCDGLPGATHISGREFKELGERASWEEELQSIVTGDIQLCIGCAIFGAPGFLSHVFLGDSLPADKNYRLSIRTMVAIDRRTGASYRRALYSAEFVEPGARFTFNLRALNLPNYALGWLAEVLLDLDAGLIRVGGLKSRGFGRVKFSEIRVAITGKGVEETVLKPLDPIDSEVAVSKPYAEGSKAKEILKALTTAWRESLVRLKLVSNSGWRWVKVLEQTQR